MSIMGVVKKIKGFLFDVICYLYAVCVFTVMMTGIWLAGTMLVLALIAIVFFNVKENIRLSKALFTRRSPDEYV